jgi:CRP-like cAMP-binding protein
LLIDKLIMPNALIRKLGSFELLSKAESQAVLAAYKNVRKIGPRKLIIQQGDKPHEAYVILEGIACRYKLLPEGTRQIMDFLIPGDLCDGHVFVIRKMDHSIGTISPCTVAYVDLPRLAKLIEEYPRISRALWWVSLIDEAVLREWIANVGRRPADKRIAHLLCELFMRLERIGQANGSSVEVPISQIDLADAVALSTVHTNRVLRSMAKKKLIAMQRGSITVKDVKTLMQIAEFDSSYLDMNGRKAKRPNRQNSRVSL